MNILFWPWLLYAVEPTTTISSRAAELSDALQSSAIDIACAVARADGRRCVIFSRVLWVEVFFFHFECVSLLQYIVAPTRHGILRTVALRYEC